MKNQFYMGCAVCVLLCAVLAACGNKEPAAPAAPAPPPAPLIASADPKPGEVPLPPKEELYAQWLEEAQKPDAAVDPEKLSVFAGLVGQYPDGFGMFYDLLAKADTDPHLKMKVVLSLTQYVFPEDSKRLIEMTKAENDATTRSCAAYLLASIPKAPEEATTRLRELKKDGTQQVRLTAILALASHGDEETKGQLVELWKEKDLSINQRANILAALPDAGPEVYRDIYLEAVQMPDLVPQLRQSLVEQLSQLNDVGVRDALQKIGENDADADVKLMAQGAAEAMRARMEAPQPADAVTTK